MNAIRFIRTRVFEATQKEFAAIAGVIQSTISRWENGASLPNLHEMASIRSAARAQGIDWNDDYFYGTHPSQIESTEPDFLGINPGATSSRPDLEEVG